MFDDQIRLRLAQLLQRVVAGQHGAGMNAAMLRGLDVVLHVADEQRFVRHEPVFGEDFVDFFALVQNIGVRPVKEGVEAGHAALDQKMVAVDGAQHERAQLAGAAKFKKIARVRQFRNRILDFAVMAVEPVFQLRQRHVRRVAVIKIRERQGKFRAKFLQRHFRAAGLGENKIGRLPDGGQIVHQRARPVENDVANHAGNLTARTHRMHKINKFSAYSRVSFGKDSFAFFAFIAFKICPPCSSPSTNRSACCRSSPATARRTARWRNLVSPKTFIPIGRLDADSEGLLLLSDEPEWNERLLHPRHAHEREYWAQVERIPTPEALKKLATRRFHSRPENPAVPRVDSGAATGSNVSVRSGGSAERR